jgi:RHS repeat-associated protein
MAKTTYMWDELSDNVAAEYDDGVLSAAYTHESDLYGNLLSQNRNGVTSYYHYDGRGDTVALTDDSGNVTDTKEYDAWGNVIASTGSTVTPYQFIGRQGYQSDAITRGYYARNRQYWPQASRWLSWDMLWPIDNVNPYVYCLLNSPESLSIPAGR